MNISSIIVEKIESLVDQAGITVSQMLKECGLNLSLINDMKKKGSIPSAEKIIIIADYFGISTDFLLGRTLDEELYLKDLPLQAMEDIKEYISFIRQKYTK